jgi:hypothetical protein
LFYILPRGHVQNKACQLLGGLCWPTKGLAQTRTPASAAELNFSSAFLTQKQVYSIAICLEVAQPAVPVRFFGLSETIMEEAEG